MEKNFIQELKELLDKYEVEDKLKDNCKYENEILPLISKDGAWILAILSLGLLGDGSLLNDPRESNKEKSRIEPVVVISMGDDE